MGTSFEITEIVLVDKQTLSSEKVNPSYEEVQEINMFLSKYGYKLAIGVRNRSIRK